MDDLPRRDVTWVFLGPQRLRAGWAVLLFAGFWWMLLNATGFLIGPLLHIDPDAPLTPLSALTVEVWQLGSAIAATLVMSLLERKPALSYGYSGRARGARFFFGMVWGFVAISVLVLALWRLGYVSLEKPVVGAGYALHHAALWGLVFLLTGFFEESLFRGYAQFTLARGIGFWWGALLVAALFGVFHHANPGESPVGLVAAGSVGLVFCLSLWYTGSLWWAVGFHAAWDWGQTFFYGTADSGMVAQGHWLREQPAGAVLWSGGSTGPEGSVLILPLLAVIALGMWLWWGRRLRSPFAGGAWRAMDPRDPTD